MGFSVDLLILAPSVMTTRGKRIIKDPFSEPVLEKQMGPEKNYTVWKAAEWIKIGRITRIEKISDKKRFSHLNYSARTRAGICTVSWLLEKLFQELTLPNHELFAPEFVIYGKEWRDRPAPENYPVPFDLLKAGAVFIDCMDEIHYHGLHFLFTDEILKDHNRKIRTTLPEMLRSEVALEFDLFEAPVIWTPAGMLANWLEELESTIPEPPEMTELKRVDLSLATMRAWKALLTEFGKVDTKVLFVFS